MEHAITPGTQSNTNTGSNTAGQTAGGGAAGGGGTNTANQGIGQTNTNQQFAQCVGSGDISGACNNTGTNPIQIQEATLLVKQPVVELVEQVELTLQIKELVKQILISSLHSVYQQAL